jgi:hypothetical protein
MGDGPPEQTLVIVSHHPNAEREMPQPWPEAYIGYFQNRHGEQWIYVLDPAVAHKFR